MEVSGGRSRTETAFHGNAPHIPDPFDESREQRNGGLSMKWFPEMSFFVIGLIFAIGDFVAYKTKAIASMLFVSGLIFLFGFWYGLPKTIFEDAGLVKIGIYVIPMLLVYMGTMMKLRDLRNEWKTVTIALAAIVAVGVALLVLGGPIIGKQYGIVAAGPISGGVVATIIMSEGATAKGMTELSVFATLLLVLQNFVGLPIASWCLSREGKRQLAIFKSGDAHKGGAAVKSDPEQPTWRIFPPLPKSLQTPYILIAKTLFVGVLALLAAPLLNNVVHKYILCLIFGIIAYEVGFLEHKVLDKANATGFVLFPLMVVIFMSLPKATPDMVMKLIYPITMAFVISVIGIFAFTFVAGKILKVSWEMALAIGTTCLFGFPGTFIVSSEVSHAVGKTPEEQEFVLGKILPPMLVGGFTTVTIASVFLAGFLVKML